MAPEMVLHKPYNEKIDIWSLGILLFELVEGRTPFKGKTTSQKFVEILNNNFTIEGDCSEECRDLITKLLKSDPAERISLDEMFAHPWMKKHEAAFNINLNNYIYTPKKRNQKANQKLESKELEMASNSNTDPTLTTNDSVNTSESSFVSFEPVTMRDLPNSQGANLLIDEEKPVTELNGPPNKTNGSVSNYVPSYSDNSNETPVLNKLEHLSKTANLESPHFTFQAVTNDDLILDTATRTVHTDQPKNILRAKKRLFTFAVEQNEEHQIQNNKEKENLSFVTETQKVIIDCDEERSYLIVPDKNGKHSSEHNNIKKMLETLKTPKRGWDGLEFSSQKKSTYEKTQLTSQKTLLKNSAQRLISELKSDHSSDEEEEILKVPKSKKQLTPTLESTCAKYSLVSKVKTTAFRHHSKTDRNHLRSPILSRNESFRPLSIHIKERNKQPRTKDVTSIPLLDSSKEKIRNSKEEENCLAESNVVKRENSSPNNQVAPGPKNRLKRFTINQIHFKRPAVELAEEITKCLQSPTKSKALKTKRVEANK